MSQSESSRALALQAKVNFREMCGWVEGRIPHPTLWPCVCKLLGRTRDSLPRRVSALPLPVNAVACCKEICRGSAEDHQPKGAGAGSSCKKRRRWGRRIMWRIMPASSVLVSTCANPTNTSSTRNLTLRNDKVIRLHSPDQTTDRELRCSQAPPPSHGQCLISNAITRQFPCTGKCLRLCE